MKLYFVKTPRIFKLFFFRRIWNFSTKKKAIYLTFDDGPTPDITEWTLNELEKHNAKATFFCIGKNAEKHPEIIEKIIANNHAIGNHTFNHLKGVKTTISNFVKNTLETQQLFERNTTIKTQNSKLFRPPYGRMTLKQAKELRKKGFKIIMWDVLSGDFDTSITKEKCLQNVIKNIESGSIVVFHDSEKASEKLKYVLPQLLEYYTYKGYQFKKIDT